MTDRESGDRQLGMYIGIGLVLGALLGLLATALLGGELFWIGVGAGVGLIVATALALGLEADSSGR
jgi:hypothetical protein